MMAPAQNPQTYRGGAPRPLIIYTLLTSAVIQSCYLYFGSIHCSLLLSIQNFITKIIDHHDSYVDSSLPLEPGVQGKLLSTLLRFRGLHGIMLLSNHWFRLSLISQCLQIQNLFNKSQQAHFRHSLVWPGLCYAVVHWVGCRQVNSEPRTDSNLEVDQTIMQCGFRVDPLLANMELTFICSFLVVYDFRADMLYRCQLYCNAYWFNFMVHGLLLLFLCL